MVNNKASRHIAGFIILFVNMWLLNSAGACVCFTIMFVLMKRLSNQGTSAVQILSWIYLVALSCYLVHLLMARQAFILPKNAVVFLLIAGILSYLGNYMMMKAMNAAPNSGYAIAIVSLDALLLVFVSALILGEHLSWLKITGTILCVAGASLLAL